jgi:hypothetical protein
VSAANIVVGVDESGSQSVRQRRVKVTAAKISGSPWALYNSIRIFDVLPGFVTT